MLTAFDFKTPKKDKKKGTPAVVTPGETAVAEEAGAVASNLSLPKDSETSVTRKETAEGDDGEDSMCVIVAEKMVCRVYVGRRRVRWSARCVGCCAASVWIAITDNEIRDILRRSVRELTRRKDGAMNVCEDGGVCYREKCGNNKKSALETAAAARGATIPTAISSTDGTKILKNIDNLAKEYEGKNGNWARTFVGDVADALGIHRHTRPVY